MDPKPFDRRAQIRRFGSGMAALGGTVGVLAASLQPFESTKAFAIPCFIVSGMLVLVGLAMLLAWCFLPVTEAAHPFVLRVMTKDEIESVRAFAERHLGSDLLSVDQMKAMLKRNAELVWVAESKPRDLAEKPQIVGCISLYPLKQGAVALLEKGDYAAAIVEGFITSKHGSPRGYYIGAVVGSTVQARAFILHKLKALVAVKCHKKCVSKLFGRPITVDGIRILKKNGFKCVIGNGPPKHNFVCWRTWSPDQ